MAYTESKIREEHEVQEVNESLEDIKSSLDSFYEDVKENQELEVLLAEIEELETLEASISIDQAEQTLEKYKEVMQKMSDQSVVSDKADKLLKKIEKMETKIQKQKKKQEKAEKFAESRLGKRLKKRPKLYTFVAGVAGFFSGLFGWMGKKEKQTTDDSTQTTDDDTQTTGTESVVADQHLQQAPKELHEEEIEEDKPPLTPTWQGENTVYEEQKDGTDLDPGISAVGIGASVWAGAIVGTGLSKGAEKIWEALKYSEAIDVEATAKSLNYLKQEFNKLADGKDLNIDSRLGKQYKKYAENIDEIIKNLRFCRDNVRL